MATKLSIISITPSLKVAMCDSVLFSYKMLIGIWVISIDRIAQF